MRGSWAAMLLAAFVMVVVLFILVGISVVTLAWLSSLVFGGHWQILAAICILGVFVGIGLIAFSVAKLDKRI